jgi:hypothetical protein
MSYADDLPRRLPPPFGASGRALAAAFGQRLDTLVDLFREAVHARLPGLCPADALPLIGTERSLPQAVGETDADYATRLKGAWDIWAGDNTPVTGTGGGGGSPLGLLNALKAAGFPTGATGATIVYQNGRYAQLDAGGEVVLGTLMVCANRVNLLGAVQARPGWTFNTNDNFHSIFGILFPVATTVVAGTINSIVVKWRPGKALFVGTWVLTSGRLWGWPPNGTWGSGNWGGTVTFHPGPNGEPGLVGYHV